MRALVSGCGFVFPADLTLAAVQRWLEALQQPTPAPVLPDGDRFRPGILADLLDVTRQAVAGLAARSGLTFTGKGKARFLPRPEAAKLLALACQGDSERTASYYAREAKGFSGWLVRQGALPADPLADLPGATLQASHRHDRRSLEEDELVRLLDVTLASARSFRGLTGPDRHALYLCALSTGFRAGELASLTPASFRLDDKPPVVLLGEQATKNKQGAVQPLPAQAVAVLKDYLRGRCPALPVWPGAWLPDAVDMLRADLLAAGIASILPGPDGELFLDFHGLRHSFIARLDRAGVPLKVASELARHSSIQLTAKVYARPRLHDLAGAVGKLDTAPRTAAPSAEGATAAG